MTQPEVAYTRPSVSFRVISIISGLYTVLVLGPGMVVLSDAPLEQAQLRALAVFCIVTYLFFQASCASHQWSGLHTMRTRIYFWLFASFPLWSIPTAWCLFHAIHAIPNVFNRA